MTCPACGQEVGQADIERRVMRQRVVDINALCVLAPLPRTPVPRPSRPQPCTPPPAGAVGTAPAYVEGALSAPTPVPRPPPLPLGVLCRTVTHPAATPVLCALAALRSATASPPRS